MHTLQLSIISPGKLGSPEYILKDLRTGKSAVVWPLQTPAGYGFTFTSLRALVPHDPLWWLATAENPLILNEGDYEFWESK